MWISNFLNISNFILITSFTLCSECDSHYFSLCSCIDFIIMLKPSVPQTYFRYLNEHHANAGNCMIMLCFNSSLLIMSLWKLCKLSFCLLEPSLAVIMKRILHKTIFPVIICVGQPRSYGVVPTVDVEIMNKNVTADNRLSEDWSRATP